jgi:AraC family transcriptional regulator of adaptative response/methylated-DNA-[protein]-cysteine methyltransferase
MHSKDIATQLSHYEAMRCVLEYIDSIYPHEAEPTELVKTAKLCKLDINVLFSIYVNTPPKQYLRYLRRDYPKRTLEASANWIAAAYRAGLNSTGRLHTLLVTTETVTRGKCKDRGAGLTITYSLHESAFGNLFVAETDKGICELQFFDNDAAPLVAALQERWPRAKIAARESSDFLVAKIFERSPHLKIHLMGTSFQLKVWQALLKIPEAKLVSYSDVAAAIGNRRAVRATATAIAQNRIACLIPCHRVVCKTGAIGDYRWGATRKRLLIGHEAARY